MNVKKFNSVRYANKEEYITGLTELGKLLNLSFEAIDTDNYIMHYPGDSNTGIRFTFISDTRADIYLCNNNYSKNLKINNNFPGRYFYYAISDDGKTKAIGFGDETVPAISIFITSAISLTDPNEEIIVFGGQYLQGDEWAIVSKDFYEDDVYNRDNILYKDNLIMLSPMITLQQNKCYKLYNIYTTIIFKQFTNSNTQEFLLNDKYYISTARYRSNTPRPLWVMQI